MSSLVCPPESSISCLPSGSISTHRLQAYLAKGQASVVVFDGHYPTVQVLGATSPGKQALASARRCSAGAGEDRKTHASTVNLLDQWDAILFLLSMLFVLLDRRRGRRGQVEDASRKSSMRDLVRRDAIANFQAA